MIEDFYQFIKHQYFVDLECEFQKQKANNMKTKILLTIAVLFLLIGCTPEQPTINIPPESIYEYKHQIIDTSEKCRPKKEELSAHLNKYYQIIRAYVTVEITEKKEIDESATLAEQVYGNQPTTLSTNSYNVDVKEIEAVRAIILCVQTDLETELKKQTSGGWEVTSIQPLDSGIYEMGIEYSFVVIFRKLK